MARSDRSADDIEAVSVTLDRVAETLRHVASRMRESEIPTILIHWDTQTKHHIPMLAEWSGRLRGEVEAQIEAFRIGVQSRAEKEKVAHKNKVKARRATKTKKGA